MLRISPSPLVRWRRLATRVAAGAAAVISVWCLYLAATIPSGDGHALGIFWVGLDALEAVAAAATAVALVRRSPRAAFTAGLFAVLMVVDASVDVATASGLDLVRAIAQAVLSELPFAVLAAWLAGHVRCHPSRLRPGR